MKNILVPTDFSINAYEALFFATRLFRNKECNFFILHTFEVNTPYFTSRVNTEKGKLEYQRKQAEVNSKLDEVLHCIIRDSDDLHHSFETISVSKPFKETVHKTINKKEIDLVVMGTKGAGGIKEFFLGSNTVKISESLHDTPLLMVPSGIANISINKIGFASSFEKKISERATLGLHKFCRLNESELKVIHVSKSENLSENQEANKSTFETAIEGLKYSNIYEPKTDSIEKHLIKILTEFELDILIMVKFMHDDYYKLTHQPIIKKLGYHISTPFLIIPN